MQLLSWMSNMSYNLNVDDTDFMSGHKKTFVLLEVAFTSPVSKNIFCQFFPVIVAI